ncbi:uncharacterized protein LOC135717303 [Ochlerotatus camptorhynchus]|uniref:uncharacterized protein LOC135717303 n=1 Tax=Ochlerotatus camptorhynchus TaxID=644619 RepID=UPI0031E469A4
MKYCVIQFKDGSKKVVPMSWIYCENVKINKKYPTFFNTDMTKKAPENPAMLKTYKEGDRDKCNCLHIVYVVNIAENLAQATDAIQQKRIAVKPRKIQTDSDDVISQLPTKRPKRDNNSLLHKTAKHLNEDYLTAFVSINPSSTSTNLSENLKDPLHLSLTPSMQSKKTCSIPSKSFEDRAVGKKAQQLSSSIHFSPSDSFSLQSNRSRAISPMPHEELVQLSSSNKNWVHASTRQSHISPQIGRTSSLKPITACLQSSTPSPSDSVLSSVTSSSDSSLNTVPCTPEHRVNVSRQLNYGPRKLPRVSGIVGEVNNGWPQELQNEQSATGRQSRTPSSRSITLAEESPQLPSVSGIVGKVNNDRSQLQNEHTDTGRHNRKPSSRYITVAEESLQLPSVSGIVDKVNNGRPQELQNEHIATGCQSRTPSPLAFTVGVESPQIRFRASNTHEEFVPETGSLERDNCKNCQKVKKRLENAETRIHVLTELNLNLQMEKVKLMAQNKEKAPFVNSVEEW